VTGRSTYRDLVDGADGDAARAVVELETAQLNGRTAALEAVAAYRALLGAIHAHVKALVIHADRLDIQAASSPGDAAAAQIIRGLITFAYLPGLVHCTAAGPATAWVAATTSLRAATDLLTTYRNLYGAIRTPDALQLQDPAYRATELVGIGNLTCMVLESERELALRAGQAGMARQDIERLLPDLSPLLCALRALSAAGEPGRDDQTLPAHGRRGMGSRPDPPACNSDPV
jgi:hypothetical protein